ncbi:D-alanyl-D-alanine carboxypeptidase [Clostridium tetanomorphum]|nr:D-alanyl-D-alanine carboxypeptidase [Clostridium tetanomorphum]
MLMNHGFSKFECKKILTKDSNVEKIQLGKRDDKFFMAKALEDLNVVVERGSKNKITKKCVVNLDKKHYNKGEVIGYCEVYLNENLIGKGKIYCDREIKKSGFFDNLKYNFNNLFNNGI